MRKKFSKPTLSRLVNGDISPKQTSTKLPTTRLDHYLVENYADFNRSTLQKYIKDGLVKVDGEAITKPNFPLTGDETIDFTPPPVAQPDLPEIPIIYEDDNVLVLDKPAGLLSMSKGEHNPEPTLEDYGILVHRLDRDTSGVVILAKNEATLSQLQKQFQQRKTHKTYYAIVDGHPDPARAIINIPIARNLARPSTFRPDPEGREAITEYEVVDTKNNLSLIKLKPTTGRTHQLRVHLAHIGTPIIGDKIYNVAEHNNQFSIGALPRLENLAQEERVGAPKSSIWGDGRGECVPSLKRSAPRMFLHATELEITIPGGHRKTFKSPLPEDFRDALK